MSFGRVTERWDRAMICGQGPSWADVDLRDVRHARKKGAAVIAVNGAIDALGETATHFFTLDFSPENHKRIREPVDGVRYYVAAPEDYREAWAEYEHVTYLRRISEGGEPDGRPFRERVWEQIPGGLADDPGEIHTGNSGFGALNLAYHFRARRVVLLGVDGRGRERWDGSHNGPLEHLPDLFATAEPQLMNAGVKVLNGSRESAVVTWARAHPSGAIWWLVGG